MDHNAEVDVTQLLLEWGDGDRDAFDQLMPVVMAELRRRADAYMRRERRGHTLQPTALIHEAYLRLVDQRRVHWRNRSQFFGVAAQMMRRVLVDHARAQGADKRGAGVEQLTLIEAIDVPAGAGGADGIDLLALDLALDRLARLDPRQAKVVELRYFAGLSLDETAEALGVHHATVSRDWRDAKAWLYRALASRPAAADPHPQVAKD
ncbi:MAG: ECF-type sigma factor [Acidobacteriota bacterium]